MYTVVLIPEEGGEEVSGRTEREGDWKKGEEGGEMECRGATGPSRRCHFSSHVQLPLYGRFSLRQTAVGFRVQHETLPGSLGEARPLATWIAFRSSFHSEPTADQFFCREGSRNYGFPVHVQVEPKNSKL